MRLQGLKTIELIENLKTWDFRVTPTEFCIRDTFYHTVRSIFEDAGNWFLKDSTPYIPQGNPSEDLNRAVDRIILAISDFNDNDLSKEFTFQWGTKSTVAGAIQQNLFHAVGHFSQLRNWTGIYKRNQDKPARTVP